MNEIRYEDPKWNGAPEFLSVSEAADLLNCGDYSVRKMIRDKKIPHMMVGPKFRIPKSLLYDHLMAESIENQQYDQKARRKI